MGIPQTNKILILKISKMLKDYVKSIRLHLAVLTDTEDGRIIVEYDLSIDIPEVYRPASANYIYVFLSALNWNVREIAIVDQEIDTELMDRMKQG